MTGVLNINKPAGWTSHDVVSKARRILQEKRIGHTGTLDPLATGVLVLCAGKATRIARYLESTDKEYEAVMRLGTVTDTHDADGKILETRQYAPPATGTIEEALKRFTGIISQRPPVFSALKVSGVPSYKLARQGKAAPLKERLVTIHGIRLLEYHDPEVRFSVHCSKGTYIRSLCADLGDYLGCGAHLAALLRTRSGRFRLDDAITLEQLADMVLAGNAGQAMISLFEALSDFPVVTVSEADSKRMAHGNAVALPAGHDQGAEGEGPVRVCDLRGGLLAVARAGEGMLRPEVVLV